MACLPGSAHIAVLAAASVHIVAGHAPPSLTADELSPVYTPLHEGVICGDGWLFGNWAYNNLSQCEDQCTGLSNCHFIMFGYNNKTKQNDCEGFATCDSTFPYKDGSPTVFSRGPPPSPPPGPAPPTPPPGPAPAPPTPGEVMKGVAYSPVPLKGPGRLPDDDFFSDQTEPLWGSSGRGDLEIIRSLGANSVRLYGNDPRYPHGKFLNEAHRLGVSVVAGISDYPYTQASGNCVSKGFDCFQDIKDQWTSMMKNGFVDNTTKVYHSALQHVNLINEPDLKIFGEGVDGWCKAIVSAFDGILAAEREAGVKGDLPSLTATFSFGICGSKCGNEYGSKPALGQMVALEKAFLNPSSIGYTPKADVTTIYRQRFLNSFNTANPARDMWPLFLGSYKDHFGMKPVFIGEFHKPGWNTEEDLKQLMDIAGDKSNPLMGASFFEFQVRYDKGGSEMEFGMFGLGDKAIGKVPLGDSWENFTINCLTDVWDKAAGKVMSKAVANAFGGPGVSATHLCPKTTSTELLV